MNLYSLVQEGLYKEAANIPRALHMIFVGALTRKQSGRTKLINTQLSLYWDQFRGGLISAKKLVSLASKFVATPRMR